MKILWIAVLLTLLLISHAQLCSFEPPFKQEICSEHQDSQVFPSWCGLKNPFSTPFLFSDVHFPIETRDAKCMNDTPTSDCHNVAKIRSIGLEVENGDTIQFLLFATVFGTVYSLDFNRDQIILVTQEEIDGAITHMDVLSNATDGYVVISTEVAAYLYFGRYPDVKLSQTGVVHLNLTETTSFMEHKIIKTDTDLYLASLVHERAQNATDPQNVYRLDFRRLSRLQHATDPLFSWKITGVRGLPGLTVFSQAGGFVESILVSMASSHRLLFMLYDDYEVKIIQFAPENLEIEFNSDKLTQKLSTFYLLDEATINSGKIISNADLMGPGLRRIDFNKSNCSSVSSPPSQEIYLVAVLWSDTEKTSTMVLRSLLEFSNFDFVHNETTPLNPVARRNICANSTQYFDTTTGSCQTPFTSSMVIRSQVLDMQVKFVDIPEQFNKINSKSGGKVNLQFLCQLIAAKGGFSPSAYMECMQFANTTACDVDAFKKMLVDGSLSYGIEYALNNFWISQIFLSTSDNNVVIYGAQQLLCTKYDLLVREFNTVPLIGAVQDLHASENGQHLFVTVSRKKWELDAVRRYGEICEALEADPDNIFLKPYAESCAQTPPQPTDLNQYGQYVSSCFAGTFCPSLSKTVIEQVESGLYTLRPNRRELCEESYFCQNGVRIECPIGYRCPTTGLKYPIRCDGNSYQNTTCYNQGLTAPARCPDGALCIAPYFPPLPTSPGTYLKNYDNGTREILPCELGDWCSLGRYATNDTNTLLCPAVFSCDEADVMTPRMCNCSENGCDYCPEGTFNEIPCIAGFYCTRPDVMIKCDAGEWCPAGTVIPQPCPPGYYCPNPAEKIICPRRHYCDKGSIVPHHCPLLSLCKEGSSVSHSEIIGGVTYAVLIVVCTLLYGLYRGWAYYDRLQSKSKPRKKRSLASKNITTKDGVEKRRFNINFRFENLGLKLRTNGSKVLDSVNGEIKSGELTAVMGLSGCGKSTFVTTLAGRAYYGVQQGKIFINGKEDSLVNYEKLVGFVPQEDIMIRTMTVEEILYFSARTRLDMWKSRQQIADTVDSVISVLGLDDIRHSVIGDENVRGISGGQRKRVNIGIELVSDPCALFLDEPTSGLDSSSSFEVCHALRQIAESGMTVVTVIHQPRYEIFKMFHTVLLLGKGGRVVYLGPSEKALGYFESLGFECAPHVNPPDFFMDVINGDVKRKGHPNFKPSDLFNLWQTHRATVPDQQEDTNILNVTDEHEYCVINTDASKTIEPDLPMVSLKEEYKSRRRSFLIQLLELLKRSFIQQVRDMSGFFMDNFLVFLAGLFLGMIFNNAEYVGPMPKVVQDKCPGPIKLLCEMPLDDPLINMASIMPLSLGLTGVMASLATFGKDQVVFKRENQSGLSALAYFLAKNVVQIPHLLVAPLVFLAIFTSIYSPRAPKIMYYAVLLLMHFTAYGFGYLVSLVVRTDLSQLAGVVLVLIFQLLGGARPTIPQMRKMFFPLPYLHYFSYISYGQEALYLIEIREYSKIYQVEKGMEVFGYEFSDLHYCLIMVAAIGVIVRIFAYIALRTKRPDSYFNLITSWILDTQGHAMRVKVIVGHISEKYKSLTEKPPTSLNSVDQVTTPNDPSEDETTPMLPKEN